MTEQEIIGNEAQSVENEDKPGQQQIGTVRGVPGKNIAMTGILDLRGVPAELVSQIESLQMIGTVIVDTNNKDALAQVPAQMIGTVAVADPDMRILIEENLEFSKAVLEAMEPNQKLMVIGTVYFKPDVPPNIVHKKIADLRIIGILLACEGVLGALFGRMEITGTSITLPDDVGEVIRSVGENTLTEGYLQHLQDHTIYLSIGKTIVADDVPLSLLAQKIRLYYNVGETVSPRPLLELLKARCPQNMGEFSETGKQGEDT